MSVVNKPLEWREKSQPRKPKPGRDRERESERAKEREAWLPLNEGNRLTDLACLHSTQSTIKDHPQSPEI
jgi:hypothetical protein